MANAFFSAQPSQHMMNFTPSRPGQMEILHHHDNAANANNAILMSKRTTEMNPAEPLTCWRAGPGELEPNAALEADLLRRTLIDLLVENEQLRTALQGNQGVHPEHNADHLSHMVQGGIEQLCPQQFGVARHSSEARRAAVARFQGKKKRRLLAMKQGPRYVKMKAVADGKKRNSSGKFVKGEQIVVVAPAVSDDQSAPQILEVQIEPRLEEPRQK